MPADQNFLVKVDESDTNLAPNTKIIITNKSGKELQTTKSGDAGGFKFSFPLFFVIKKNCFVFFCFFSFPINAVDKNVKYY